MLAAAEVRYDTFDMRGTPCGKERGWERVLVVSFFVSPPFLISSLFFFSTKPCPACGGDCAYWDQSTYKMAMTSSPDIVTIMLGTNDAKGKQVYRVYVVKENSRAGMCVLE